MHLLVVCGTTTATCFGFVVTNDVDDDDGVDDDVPIPNVVVCVFLPIGLSCMYVSSIVVKESRERRAPRVTFPYLKYLRSP